MGPCREGSMPPAPHGLRTEGGEGARRRRLRRSINVGGHRGETADCGEDDEDDERHHGRGRRQQSPGFVPTIGREVVARGTDVNVGVGGGGGSGGGTYGLIVNRLALHLNRQTPRGGSLTKFVRTGRRRDQGGWRRRTAAAAARGGRRGWRRFTTTYHPTISVVRGASTLHNNQLRRWKRRRQ